MSPLDLLSSLPAAVWTGFIGAGFALGGVLIANRHQRRLQRTQLQHDAAGMARERTAVLAFASNFEGDSTQEPP